VDTGTVKNDLEKYNKEIYAFKWLNAADERLSSDYYKKDHYLDTLETLIKARGAKALECGIGTGEFFAMCLAENGKDVYGIDFSEPLLIDCKDRFRKKGHVAHLAIADAAEISFKDNSFDVVFAIGVMPFMKDLDHAVNEMLRVTKKGGIVVFDMMNLCHISQFINHLYKVAEASKIGFNVINSLKKLKKSLGLKTNFKELPEKPNHRLISPFEILKVVKKTGAKFQVRGYNVLLPLDMPVLGRAGNLCRRFPYFERGLKDSKLMKYFGAKLVFIIKK
jgi:ubiquinone/menaquinone biosynthesis C-methylase UbiE